MQDASEVMDMLLKAQVSQEELEDDDPQVSYMMSAWARMCKVLGSAFQQYLHVVMPPLMKVVQHKPEVQVVDRERLTMGMSSHKEEECRSISAKPTNIKKEKDIPRLPEN